jgi:hypothetical protein
MPKKITAAQQFEKLGLGPADYTTAMRNAVNQRWSELPVDRKVDELRADLAAVTREATATVEELLDAEVQILAQNGVTMTVDELPAATRDAAVKEAERLKRNAGVNAWRERGKIQAALDARELRFAAMRAGKARKTAAAFAVELPAPAEAAPVATDAS